MRHVPLNNYIAPEFTPQILEEDGGKIVVRDRWGTVECWRMDKSTLPQIVGGPVQTRDDWEQLKAERLKPMLNGRLPADWEQLKSEFRARDYPLALGGSQGFVGTARRLLGVMPLLRGFYDQPDLIHDIMDYLAEFWCAIYGQLLQQIDVDLALIWEDMCYKTGPLISPAHFRDFMLSPYRKLTDVFRHHGIRVILTDTDGNFPRLLALFLESGVIGLYPFKVAAGMDVVKVREAFPRLQMLGGIDKRALAEGPAAINAELGRASSIIKDGGFIPDVDHAIPPDVSRANSTYYRGMLAGMIMHPG